MIRFLSMTDGLKSADSNGEEGQFLSGMRPWRGLGLQKLEAFTTEDLEDVLLDGDRAVSGFAIEVDDIDRRRAETRLRQADRRSWSVIERKHATAMGSVHPNMQDHVLLLHWKPIQDLHFANVVSSSITPVGIRSGSEELVCGILFWPPALIGGDLKGFSIPVLDADASLLPGPLGVGRIPPIGIRNNPRAPLAPPSDRSRWRPPS